MTPDNAALIVLIVNGAVLLAIFAFALGQHWPCQFPACRRRRMREDWFSARPDSEG